MEGVSSPPPEPSGAVQGHDNRADSAADEAQQCAVCYLPYLYPLQLCCGHVFCFLCIKGVVMAQSANCPMCRKEFPKTMIKYPVLRDPDEFFNGLANLPNTRYWYYESRSGGWWQYDQYTMAEVESRFSNREQSFNILIAGRMYVIDFNLMMQYRLDYPGVFRRITFGTVTNLKGVGGIEVPGLAG